MSMSLLKRQHEKERKAAEEAARLAEENKLRDMAVHPLVKDGCNRDVRDGYFYGLVFAAIADDDKIDQSEKSILLDIGSSIGFSVIEVNDAIERVTSLSDDQKLSLIAECIATIKDRDNDVKLFYAQFVLLWTSLHEHDADDLNEYLLLFKDKTGVDFPTAKRHAVIKVLEGEEGVDGALDALAKWMGEDALKYFVVKQYGDVSERLTAENRRKKEAFAKKKEKLLKEIERARFTTSIQQISEAHEFDASLKDGWNIELEEKFSSFESKYIDWQKECTLRRAELDAILHCNSKLLFDHQERPRRKIVWKLMCMLYVFGGSVRSDEIDDLLRSAVRLSTGGYRKKIESFINKHFKGV